jgi:hypothetical protein
MKEGNWILNICKRKKMVRLKEEHVLMGASSVRPLERTKQQVQQLH